MVICHKIDGYKLILDICRK